MRPESFKAELQEDWSRWVLAHGLPELPGPDLAPGESVPVTYWIGPDTAAVLHIRHVWLEDDDEPTMETDINCFYREGGTWIGSGSGGGGWYERSPLARGHVPPDHVELNGMNGGSAGERGCKALWGEIGTDVAILEVAQGGQVTRRPAEAPVGIQVVCGQHSAPLAVRVLNSRDELMAQIDEEAGWS